MVDLSPRWMLVKAALFVVIGLLSAGFLMWQNPSWATAACLGALVWASARACYFLFHAVQHWIDPEFRYRGLLDLGARLWRRRS